MIIATNWKAYVESVEKAKKISTLAKRLALRSSHEIIIAPPATFLGLLAEKNHSKVSFMAQDISSMTGGAHTGEITASMARNSGASYALVGHSERRAMGENNELITKKLQHILAQGLTPVLCVGESKRDDDGSYLTFLREEIIDAFEPLTRKERLQVVIAYEPIWAIGKKASESITVADLTEMVLYIRKILTEFLSGRATNNVRVLYGGSVEPNNIRTLAEGSGIDGFLIGHASVELESFSALVKELEV
ncbi:Triosephosphate isomerase [hydrothermal vent metagenome]|uniref:Triosephosphate isomerase n=1 Tax=hydrothermal vent metagenome TaxID=652676 RepID=A0A3B0V8P0_9ZZZZ